MTSVARSGRSVTFALVPGAGGSAWSWHPVARELESRGHRAVPVDLAAGDDAAGLEEYVAAVVAEVPQEVEDLVVVGMSMGGLTAPLVATRVPVRLVVLLNAMIPAPGETGSQWWALTGQRAAMVEHGRRIGLSEEDLADDAVVYGHDLPEALGVEAGRRAGAQSGRPFADPWPLATWPDVPTRVVTAREDRLFPRDFQHRLARERLGITPDDVDGGHLAMLSRPGQVAELFDRYATEVIGAARRA